MLASKNSKNSRTSKHKTSERNRWSAWVVAALVLVAVGWAAAWLVAQRGYTLYYGDADSHLNIARRILDSRTPGPEQIGTVWLPLPHLAMLPFVIRDPLWHSGVAGTIVGVSAFVFAGLMLFGAARTAFGTTAGAFAAMLLFALNPNVLYLQATPMTEPIVFASLCGVLYATLVFGKTQSWIALSAAGILSVTASLTRYEGWFVIPFVAVYIVIAGRERRWSACAVYCAIACIGPLAWLAHNAWYCGNALEFYNGPYSAKGQYERQVASGMARYAGDHDWGKAILYYRTAVEMCAGWGLVAVGIAGAFIAAVRRTWWPILFLMLPPVFYILGMYSSGNPIFVPTLWPNSYYNTRYGLAALPLLAFASAALASIVPARTRTLASAAIVLAAMLPWAWNREPITWKEGDVNFADKRVVAAEAVKFLKQAYRPGDGVLASCCDFITGILRETGIPLRESLHEGNGPGWDGALARPDLFLHEEWAIAISADPVSAAMLRTQRSSRPYRCVKIITFKNAPVIEIYRRASSPGINADSLYQSSRSEERFPPDVGD